MPILNGITEEQIAGMDLKQTWSTYMTLPAEYRKHLQQVKNGFNIKFPITLLEEINLKQTFGIVIDPKNLIVQFKIYKKNDKIPVFELEKYLDEIDQREVTMKKCIINYKGEVIDNEVDNYSD